jgi:hypothetical protein
MPFRPSRVWLELPFERRVLAATALWRDEQGLEQQVEATALLARRLNFRARSIQALSIDRRGRYLAQAADVSDGIAGRALVAYHFEHARPLMSSFLDALGIAHEEGLIADEQLPRPDQPRLLQAVETLRASFPADDVDLYLRTLLALDAETWTGLESLVSASS